MQLLWRAGRLGRRPGGDGRAVGEGSKGRGTGGASLAGQLGGTGALQASVPKGAAATQRAAVRVVVAAGIASFHACPHAPRRLHFQGQLALPPPLQQAAGAGRQVGAWSGGDCLLSRRQVALRVQLGSQRLQGLQQGRCEFEAQLGIVQWSSTCMLGWKGARTAKSRKQLDAHSSTENLPAQTFLALQEAVEIGPRLQPPALPVGGRPGRGAALQRPAGRQAGAAAQFPRCKLPKACQLNLNCRLLQGGAQQAGRGSGAGAGNGGRAAGEGRGRRVGVLGAREGLGPGRGSQQRRALLLQGGRSRGNGVMGRWLACMMSALLQEPNAVPTNFHATCDI